MHLVGCSRLGILTIKAAEVTCLNVSQHIIHKVNRTTITSIAVVGHECTAVVM